MKVDTPEMTAADRQTRALVSERHDEVHTIGLPLRRASYGPMGPAGMHIKISPRGLSKTCRGH